MGEVQEKLNEENAKRSQISYLQRSIRKLSILVMVRINMVPIIKAAIPDDNQSICKDSTVKQKPAEAVPRHS